MITRLLKTLSEKWKERKKKCLTLAVAANLTEKDPQLQRAEWWPRNDDTSNTVSRLG